MHVAEQVHGRQSGSTVSSDSGVVVLEDGLELDNAHVKNLKVSATLINENDSKNSSFRSKSSVNLSSNSTNPFSTKELIESRCSPTVSVHSHKISIESIDDDIDSSVIDSDSEVEELALSGCTALAERFKNPNAASQDGVIVINQRPDNPCTSSNAIIDATSSKPQIGSIAVQNSTDITFGNKTFYQGPVTIKQFLLDNNKWKPKDGTGTGTDNPAFENGGPDNSSGDKTDPNAAGEKILPKEKFVFNTKLAAIVGVVVLVLATIGAITFMAMSFAKARTVINPGSTLRFVSRDEWIAQPAKTLLTLLELPATKVIIAHTATEGCLTQAVCTFRTRLIQTFHMESRGWDDIGYNFLVGGDGAAYEGRGWEKQGAHTKGFNRGSICIAFIGTFNDITPNDRQLKAAKLLIEEGLRLGKLSSDYKLYGHRQLIPSESPGLQLYNIIKTWDHWSEDPVIE